MPPDAVTLAKQNSNFEQCTTIINQWLQVEGDLDDFIFWGDEQPQVSER